jgi:hypothetical protein
VIYSFDLWLCPECGRTEHQWYPSSVASSMHLCDCQTYACPGHESHMTGMIKLWPRESVQEVESGGGFKQLVSK